MIIALGGGVIIALTMTIVTVAVIGGGGDIIASTAMTMDTTYRVIAMSGPIATTIATARPTFAKLGELPGEPGSSS